jgi:BirA family transcriptional regulator, biotin operon repressor / biotin---[acetyl-CoA-carboxylase] ligase
METSVRLPHGYRLRHLVEVDSTNAEAIRLSAVGEQGPLWIWCDKQLQGRGRQGRSWISEAGNLYATLLLTLAMPTAAAGSLSVAVSLAVLAVLRRFIGRQAKLELKWPNDVLIEDRKAAGILVESTIRGEAMVFAIGCGINLCSAPSGTRYGATSLAAHGVQVVPGKALEALAEEVDQLLRRWNAGAGFRELRTEWLQYARGLGSVVSVAVGGRMIEGYFEGLSDKGCLLLRNQAGVHELPTGEVIQADMAAHR